MPEYFFFENQNEHIFAAWHQAEKTPQKGSLLFLSAFAEEKNNSRRIEYCLARSLSQEGYSVLRFDYRGTGDSAGDFEQYAVTDEISDIRAAWEKLLALAPGQKAGLLGLRWGANEAFMVCEDLRPDFVVAIAPIYDVRKYLRDCVRKNIAAQLGLYGEIVKNSQQLIEDLENGQLISFDGFMISQARYIQMLQSKLRTPSTPVLMIDNKQTKEQLQSAFPKTENKTIDLPAFWAEKNRYFSEITCLHEAVLQWLHIRAKHGNHSLI